LKSLIGLLYGGQDYDENYHYTTFDYHTLSNDLRNMGYSHIEEWNTEIYPQDDFSKAYLPHMDKENGILMSLNILAVK